MHLQRNRVQLRGGTLLRLHIGHAGGCLAGAVHSNLRTIIATQVPGGAGDLVGVQINRVGAGLAVGGKANTGLSAGELATSGVDLLLVHPAAGAEVRGLLDFLEIVVTGVTVVRGDLVALVHALRHGGFTRVDGGVMLCRLVNHAGAGSGLAVGVSGEAELHGARGLVHRGRLAVGIADARRIRGAHGGAANAQATCGHGACNLLRGALLILIGGVIRCVIGDGLRIGGGVRLGNLQALAAGGVLCGLGVVHRHPLHLLPRELVARKAAGHEVREHGGQLRVFLVHVLTLARVGRVGAGSLQVEGVGEEVVVRQDEAVFLHRGQDHAGELVVRVTGVGQELLHVEAGGQEATLAGTRCIRVLGKVQLAVGTLRGEGGAHGGVVGGSNGDHVVDLAGLQLVHANLGELVGHAHDRGGAVLEGQPVVVLAHALEVGLGEHVAARGDVVGRRVVHCHGNIHGAAGSCRHLVGNLAGGLVDGRAGHVLGQAELGAARNRVRGAGVAGLHVDAYGGLDGHGLAGVAAAHGLVLNLGALGGGGVAAANLYAGGAGVGLGVGVLHELEVGAPDAGCLVVQGEGLVTREAVVFGQPARNRHAAGQDALVLGLGVNALIAGDDLDVLLVRVGGVHREGRDVLVGANGLGAVLTDGTRVNGGGDGVVAGVCAVLEEGAADLAAVGGNGFGAGELLRGEGVAGELATQGRGVLGGNQVFPSQGRVHRCQGVDGLSGLVVVPVAGGAGCHGGEGCEGRHVLLAGLNAGGSTGGAVRGRRSGGSREGRRQVGAGDGGGQCRGNGEGCTAAAGKARVRVLRRAGGQTRRGG